MPPLSRALPLHRQLGAQHPGRGAPQRLGKGRFRGFSAGSHPKGRVHPLRARDPSGAHTADEGLRSKSWDEFPPGAPPLDFVFTVCDNAANELPVWPGQPVTAHWGVRIPRRSTALKTCGERRFKTPSQTSAAESHRSWMAPSGRLPGTRPFGPHGASNPLASRKTSKKAARPSARKTAAKKSPKKPVRAKSAVKAVGRPHDPRRRRRIRRAVSSCHHSPQLDRERRQAEPRLVSGCSRLRRDAALGE